MTALGTTLVKQQTGADGTTVVDGEYLEVVATIDETQ
jgi:hypothetical protein